MLEFYLIFLIFAGMIWYAGLEGTMRVFYYIDLSIRYGIIRFQLWQMKRKLEKDLNLPPSDFSTVFEEIQNDR